MTRIVSLARLADFMRRFGADRSGLALLEFALVLPILISMSLTGAELTNYITTKMRVSQLALRLADDAARIGTGTLLAQKTISETDINDLFEGAQLQSGELDLKGRGRVIVSSLEPIANPNPTSKYKIVWQRCYGAQTSKTSGYGTAGQTNLNGIGPTGRQVTAEDGGATMFVELYYIYKPLVGLTGGMAFTEIASMSVRDKRAPGTPGNTEAAPVSSC